MTRREQQQERIENLEAERDAYARLAKKMEAAGDKKQALRFWKAAEKASSKAHKVEMKMVSIG